MRGTLRLQPTCSFVSPGVGGADGPWPAAARLGWKGGQMRPVLGLAGKRRKSGCLSERSTRDPAEACRKMLAGVRSAVAVGVGD